MSAAYFAGVQRVLSIEEGYVSDLRGGAQSYSWPLRHLPLLAKGQHATLFLNGDKLLALSQFLIGGLRDLLAAAIGGEDGSELTSKDGIGRNAGSPWLYGSEQLRQLITVGALYLSKVCGELFFLFCLSTVEFDS